MQTPGLETLGSKLFCFVGQPHVLVRIRAVDLREDTRTLFELLTLYLSPVS